MVCEYNCCNVVRNNQGVKKCFAKGCKKRAKYSLFADDGIIRMSRLFVVSCRGHLHLAISKVWDYNKKHLSILKREKIEIDRQLYNELHKRFGKKKVK